MKIIRWLLSHIVLILLIVVVIYGYMFWGRLADSDTPGGKAIAYLSNKFAPANEGTTNEDDEQDIVAGLNAGEVSRENLADSTAKDVKNTVENNVNASRKTVVVNSESPMSSQQSDASSTIDESVVSAGAVKISEDTFVSPDVVEQLDSLDGDSVAVDANNTSSLTNRSGKASVPGEASVNDTQLTIGDTMASAGESAVETIKEIFVSPDVVEQLDSLDKDSVAVDANNTSSLTNRSGKASVNDTQLTIGDTMASAGESAVETVKEIFVSPDVEEKLNNADDIGEASQLNPKVKSTGVKASWIAARTSYHQRKYELSEKSYQQVIDNTEDNYDAYGELGNVYFNQGKNAQAASAYYEAAAILVRIGQRSRAESLIGLLWRLDPSKADELQKLIDSASS